MIKGVWDGFIINFSYCKAFSSIPSKDCMASPFLRIPPNHLSSFVHYFIQVNGEKIISNPFSSNISLQL